MVQKTIQPVLNGTRGIPKPLKLLKLSGFLAKGRKKCGSTRLYERCCGQRRGITDPHHYRLGFFFLFFDPKVGGKRYASHRPEGQRGPGPPQATLSFSVSRVNVQPSSQALPLNSIPISYGNAQDALALVSPPTGHVQARPSTSPPFRTNLPACWQAIAYDTGSCKLVARTEAFS